MMPSPQQDWKTATLGEIARVTSGGTPSRKVPAYWDGDVPWISTSLIDFCVITEADEYITVEGVENSSAKVFPKGTLLMAMFGQGVTRGKVAVLGIDAAFNQACVGITPSKNADAGYLYQFLAHSYEAIRQLSNSGSQENLNSGLIKGIHVPLPSLPEQKEIAAVASTWDRGIRQLTDLIAGKLRFKQGLMQQLLTGKRRFQKFVTSDEFQKSAAGTFPKDWTVRRLGEITEEVRRKNASGVTRVLTASGNHGLVDQRDYFNRSVAGKSLDGYYHLKRGEFAYNRSLMKGYPYGATKRLDAYDEGVVSTLYLCFSISSDSCVSDWLTHVFESDVFNSQLRGIAKMGARAHGLLNVAASEYFHMILPIPGKKEQEAIASTLETADREIDLLRKQLEAIKQQKKGLMQKLLTGEVRVKLPKGVA